MGVHVLKVVFVKPDVKRKKLQIGIGDEYNVIAYTISEDTYNSLNCPARGSEIGERTLADVRFEDEVYRATRKAIGSLTVIDKSKYELKAKLLSAGFSGDAADVVVEKCVRCGYLDEKRQIERLVEREANYKLRGRYHIRRRLAGKGYSVSDVDRAIAMLTERGDIDFDANFERLAEKRGAYDEESRAALKYRFGYKI